MAELWRYSTVSRVSSPREREKMGLTKRELSTRIIRERKRIGKP